MSDDLVKRLRDKYCCDGINICNCDESADRIEALEKAYAQQQQVWSDAIARADRYEAALLEIFDHECRTSDRSFIACTARDALWLRAALGEKKDVAED